MRFMMLIKSDANAEAGVMPGEELIAAMGRYNDELVKAGVLLAAEGLHASAKGARIQFSNGERKVIDGPFAEAKELIAGLLDDPGEVARRGDPVGAARSVRVRRRDGARRRRRDRAAPDLRGGGLHEGGAQC